MQKPYTQRLSSLKGFTLIELSIVIIIISLLVGAVIGGEALVEQARLRAVMNEHNSIRTAISAFRIHYFSLPGDFDEAQNYWGAGTEDGNGNSLIELSTGAAGSENYETYRAWQHLAMSEIYPGNFSGADGPNGTISLNIPASKFIGAGIALINETGTTYTTHAHTGNIILFARPTAGGVPNTPIFSPTNAFSIDEKIDDSLGNSGVMRSGGAIDNGAANEGCSDADGNYALAREDSPLCTFIFTL